MQTPSEISADISQMQQQLESLQRAIKQREYDLLEAELYEATGLRVGDACQYPAKNYPDVYIEYEVCIGRVGVPFLYLTCKGGGKVFLTQNDFSKLQKITT